MNSSQLIRLMQAEELPDLIVPLSAGSVRIASVLRRETRSERQVPKARDCWAPNKPALLFEGQVTWAEFVIVRLLEKAGWSGRWVKHWGGRQFCSSPDHVEDLPPDVSALFERIHGQAGALRGAGTWDVLGWKKDELLFLESKQHRSSDRLSLNQIAWLEAAVQVGIRPDQFGVVSYDAPRLVPAPSHPQGTDRRARTASRTPQNAGLGRILNAVAQASPFDRINHRDEVASFGDAALHAMQDWLNEERFPAFALAVLEVMGRHDVQAVKAIRAYIQASGRERTLASAAIERIVPARARSTREPALTDVYRSSGVPEAQIPGGCQVLVQGRRCANPGRHVVDGLVTCTTHRKSIERRSLQSPRQ